MRKQVREPEPQVLKDNGARWTKQWVKRRVDSVAAKLKNQKKKLKQFTWPQHKGGSIHGTLFAALARQTGDRCSFCGGWPMTEAMSAESIEHFRPTNQFPDRVLDWWNLFCCCSFCQQAKGKDWSPEYEELLKPDGDDYTFENYFFWNTETGELMPRWPETDERGRRALLTRDTYDINRSGMLLIRLKVRADRAVENYRRREAGLPVDPVTWQDGDWPF